MFNAFSVIEDASGSAGGSFQSKLADERRA